MRVVRLKKTVFLLSLLALRVEAEHLLLAAKQALRALLRLNAMPAMVLVL
jgi:hypothetical protein